MSKPLARELGLFAAVMMGLGSIIGTGVFVSIGLAAGVAGADVVLAIVLAAAVATCNGLSSAQLAANHPVSGGTYEYGYKYLRPWLGFAAGWMFLCAKSASAATAALGVAGYVATMLGASAGGEFALSRQAAAAGVVAAVTIVVLCGVRLSSRVNAVVVSVTLAALAAFVVAGAPDVRAVNFSLTPHEPRSILFAAALMFVAFTGYGRVATLGEEVIEPRRTIPRAIIVTLVISAAVYVAVAVVGVGSVGADALCRQAAEGGAPLEATARLFTHGSAQVERIIAIGAVTAMLGVLLNLVLGLSRVALAMGRRGDLPAPFQNVRVAVVGVGVVIGTLTAIGSVKAAWSFSAFTVLVYYAITNLAALQLAEGERMFPPLVARVGLVACLSLAFAVDMKTWLVGLGVLGAGLVWHAWRRRREWNRQGRQGVEDNPAPRSE
jgi:basic amino acid/polyamine antiporter, APA family